MIIQFGVVREIPDSFVLLKLLRQSAIILCRINVAESDWNDTTLWGNLLRGLNEQLRDKCAAGNISPGLASDLALYPPGQPSEGEVEREPRYNSSLLLFPKVIFKVPTVEDPVPRTETVEPMQVGRMQLSLLRISSHESRPQKQTHEWLELEQGFVYCQWIRAKSKRCRWPVTGNEVHVWGGTDFIIRQTYKHHMSPPEQRIHHFTGSN